MRGLTRNVAQVYTGTDVRAFDRRAIDEFGIPGIRLMHRAGAAALEALRERWPDAQSLSIVCGAGNNAGDGYVVAGLARDAGLDVQLLQVGDPAKVKGDALAAKRFAECRLGAISATGGDWLLQGDVVVDALLGTGLRGEVRETFREGIEHVNGAGRPVLALDVPSGVDADTGGLLTPEPVQADLTVTFVAFKVGLATGPGVDYAGDVLLADLGVPDDVFDRRGLAVEFGDGLRRLERRRGAHKGDFGRLLIVGGDADMGGAVLLAGEAALRTGVGSATVATRGVNRAAVLARRPELMVRAAETAADIADLAERVDAIAVGPGLGQSEWAERLLDACLAAGKPLAIDADGLNILAKRGAERGEAAGLQGLPTGTVLTPHPGEAGRLLGKDAAWVQSHRLEAAATLSRYGATVVLKGAGTLIAWGGAARSICLAGNPGMATAGSGDVLTGIVGALLGRGLSPRFAAELGVWIHASAGDEANERCQSSLLASDIVQAIDLTP